MFSPRVARAALQEELSTVSKGAHSRIVLLDGRQEGDLPTSDTQTAALRSVKGQH